MPEGRRRLGTALSNLLSLKQDKPKLYPALLGAYVDGTQQLRVINRQDFVWCRMRGATTEVIQAFNDMVGLHWDLPIWVYRDPNAPNIWRVYARDIRTYSDWEGASYLPPHGDSHSFSSMSRTGVDPVWVYKRQFMPLLPRPNVSGTMGIWVEPDFFYWQGQFHWWPGSGTVSLASHMPTGATDGRFVTVYMDGATKTLQMLDGTEFFAANPPPDPGAYITLPGPTQGIPLAAVFMTTGTQSISWGDIYDLRMPAQPLASLTASGSFVLLDEGVVLGAAPNLNFVGAGVTASISGSFATIVIPGAGPIPSTGTVVVEDEAVIQGSAPILNFVGPGVTASVSGSIAQISIPGGATIPSSGTVVIEDEAVIQGSAPILNFVGAGVTASISGSVAQVSIPGGGSTNPPITGSVVVEDEAVIQGSALILNFVGAGVTASISGSVAQISVPGGGSTNPPITGSVVVEDEAIIQGSALILNFVGAGVTATVSGSYCEVSIPGGGGGGGGGAGIMGWDEGIPLGTGTILNAVGAGVTMTISGSVLNLNIPGGGGASILQVQVFS